MQLGTREIRHIILNNQVVNSSRALHSLKHTVPKSHKNIAIHGMVATPYSGWLGLLKTALIMIIVLLFLVDLVHSAPQAGSVRAPAEKTVAGVRAVLALRGAAANRLRQRLLLEAGDMRENESELNRAVNFHHLFLIK